MTLRDPLVAFGDVDWPAGTPVEARSTPLSAYQRTTITLPRALVAALAAAGAPGPSELARTAGEAWLRAAGHPVPPHPSSMRPRRQRPE